VTETSVEVEIEVEAWAAALPDAEALACEAVLSALDLAGEAGGVVVLLTDDEAVAALNRDFRGKAGPTNVLSFPAAANPERHLGDIALAFGVCQREAMEQGKALAHHLQHLVAHGVLHLVGYDHQTDSEAEAMEALERRILARLGAPDPYAGETESDAPHG
jgi:probable rRNA maturation factor